MPLEVALKSRQPSLARTLIEHGADLNAKDSRGFSLLQAAIFKGDSYAAEFLIDQLESNGNATQLSEVIKISGNTREIQNPEELEGCTALHLITGHNSEDMLTVASLLLQRGIDPNLQNHRGWYRTSLFLIHYVKFLKSYIVC